MQSAFSSQMVPSGQIPGLLLQPTSYKQGITFKKKELVITHLLLIFYLTWFPT